jgi:hypothetical protein
MHVTMAEQLIVQDVDGESVLLDMSSECYYGLEAVGTRMWQALAEYRDVDRACQALLREYDVDEVTLRRDLLALVEKLRAAGLPVLTAS